MTIMRECFFCPNPADSKERLWPQWIVHAIQPKKPSRGRLGSLLDSRVLDYEPRFKWLCSSCNRGWISNLESTSRWLIEPLMRDIGRYLDVETQRTIARWSIKTVIALQSLAIRGSKAGFTESDRVSVRLGLAFPSHVGIWLARCADPGLAVSMGLMETRDEKLLVCYDGCVTTLTLGYLVIHVLNLHSRSGQVDAFVSVNSRSGPWKDGIIPIHAPREAIFWPPSVSFSAAGKFPLSALASRFGSSLQR